MTNATTADVFHMQTFGYIFPVIAWIASIFTFLYCLILFFKTFTGKFKPDSYEKKVHEAPFGMLISPIILASLVVIFGLFPNLLSYSLIEPTMMAIMPGLGAGFEVDISMWHGFNFELLMTAGVVLIGALLFVLMNKWSKLSLYERERDPLNWFYDQTLSGTIKGSQLVTRAQMTGRLRDYFVYMWTFMILIVAYTMFRYDALAIDPVNTAAITPYILVLTIVFIGAVVSIPFINNRIVAIIVTGVVGFLIALYFVIFRAPDLALTQLLVETVSVVLFMVAFYHLPELRKESFKPRFNFVNLLISIGVGAIVTALALSSLALGNEAGFEPISDYFIANAKELAGGYNIVNVILVDFRGLDTILEILVLAIAALGVVAMIKLRLKEGRDV